jgi:hypothetical protein
MADADTELTLEALHEAIRVAIVGAFPGFVTVEFYRDDEDEVIATPACLLEMTEAEPAPVMDSGTGQWCAVLRFEARVIMGHRTAATSLEIRKAATALATFLHQRRFPGVYADPCEVIACEADNFTPTRPNLKVWRVEFVVPAMLGASAWDNDGTIPTDPLYSWVPRIGIPHVDEYIPLTGDGPIP